MPDLFDIIVAFLDDRKKSPETREKIHSEYGIWSDGFQILSNDEAILNGVSKLFERLGAEEITVGKYGENEGEYSGCYFLEAW